MYANNKINAVLIFSCWICHYVLLVQGKKFSEILAEKESDNESPQSVAPSHPAKESVSSMPLLEKSQGETITASESQPQNQPIPQPDQIIRERIPKPVKSKPTSIRGIFHSLLQLILGQLKKLKKPSEFEVINSEAVYLFGAMKRTMLVGDKTETVKKVTDYIRRSSLFTGKYKHISTSSFEKGFEQITTTANGDCFYSAISLLFFGHENFARGLRAITAAHIALNEPFFIALNVFLHEEDLTWFTVLDIRHYAESVEIIFLSNILCRHIKVYESGGRSWYQNDLVSCKSPKEPLHLLLEKQHFSALRMKPDFPPVEADTVQLVDLPPLKIL